MQLYNPQETCRILNIGLTTFYKLVKQGKIKTLKIGALTKVSDDAIKLFIKNSLEQSHDKAA